MANQMHEANRKHWDANSSWWRALTEGDWRNCVREPTLAFEAGALEMIGELAGSTLTGKKVCVIGSGDNYAAFALAGMGAIVTSTDISGGRIKDAAERARELGLDIRFVRCDAAGLTPIPDGEFDLVCSTNGFFVWVADLAAVFAAVTRVLKSGGHYVFYDVHPFLRPWKDQTTIEMSKPYFETGPFATQSPDEPTYEFHWTVSDIVNSLLSSGLAIRRLAETPADDSRFWQGPSCRHGTDDSLLDWRKNPRAGLPAWLAVAAQKLRGPQQVATEAVS